MRTINFNIKSKKIVGIVFFITLVAALPVLIAQVKQRQDIRQRAQYEYSAGSLDGIGTGFIDFGGYSVVNTDYGTLPLYDVGGNPVPRDSSIQGGSTPPGADPGAPTPHSGCTPGQSCSNSDGSVTNCIADGTCRTCLNGACSASFNGAATVGAGTGGTINNALPPGAASTPNGNCGGSSGCSYSTTSGTTIFCSDGKCTECAANGTCTELPASRYSPGITPPPNGWSNNNQGMSCAGPGCPAGSVPPSTCQNFSDCPVQCPTTGGCNVVGPDGQNHYFNPGSNVNVDGTLIRSCSGGTSCTVSSAPPPQTSTGALPKSALTGNGTNTNPYVFDPNSGPNPCTTTTGTCIMQSTLTGLFYACTNGTSCTPLGSPSTDQSACSGASNCQCFNGYGCYITPGQNASSYSIVPCGGTGQASCTTVAQQLGGIGGPGTVYINYAPQGCSSGSVGTTCNTSINGQSYVCSGSSNAFACAPLNSSSNPNYVQYPQTNPCPGGQTACTTTLPGQTGDYGCNFNANGGWTCVSMGQPPAGGTGSAPGGGTATGPVDFGGSTYNPPNTGDLYPKLPIGEVCGDKICSFTESPANCPLDCGGGGGIQCSVSDYGSVSCCGDGICSSGETNAVCPQDCPAAAPTLPPVVSNPPPTSPPGCSQKPPCVENGTCDALPKEPPGGWCPIQPPINTPTPIPVTGGSSITVSLTLPGIGNKSGDNKNPKHSTRNAVIYVYNQQNQQVMEKVGPVVYNPSSFKYTGTISLGNTVGAGVYRIKIKLENTLRKAYPGIQTLTANSTLTLPDIKLDPGDFDQNNILDIKDWNILLSCIRDNQCPQKDVADLNDDGKIEEIDMNIILRSFATRYGD